MPFILVLWYKKQELPINKFIRKYEGFDSLTNKNVQNHIYGKL